MTSRVGMCGARHPPDELVIFDVFLFNERLYAFAELSLIPTMTTVSVDIFRDRSNRQASSLRKRVVVVMWAGRCTRVRRVDRGSDLSRNRLRGDHRVGTVA